MREDACAATGVGEFMAQNSSTSASQYSYREFQCHAGYGGPSFDVSAIESRDAGIAASAVRGMNGLEKRRSHAASLHIRRDTSTLE